MSTEDQETGTAADRSRRLLWGAKRGAERLFEPMLLDQRQLTQGEIFGLLSNSRRRHAIRYLKRNGGRCGMEALVTAIAAEENGIEPDAVERRQYRRVHVSLYQTHLPLLVEKGVLRHDKERHRIELGPRVDELDTYIDGDEEGRSWTTWYLAMVGFYAVGASALVLELTQHSQVLVAAGVLGFAIVAVVHSVEKEAGIAPISGPGSPE
ncbi:DUF7344 domain-containing protein [Natronorarus salvus]|uniref:DUF7344 domain-containing protein n=1 Tax=Natronorarus salvus TaxID=3117733 RepID=UPI002F25ED4D